MKIKEMLEGFVIGFCISIAILLGIVISKIPQYDPSHKCDHSKCVDRQSRNESVKRAYQLGINNGKECKIKEFELLRWKLDSVVSLYPKVN